LQTISIIVTMMFVGATGEKRNVNLKTSPALQAEVAEWQTRYVQGVVS
jgi:hypothetical protein